MNIHDATEAVYRNGYRQGKQDAVKHGRWEQGICTVCQFDIRYLTDGENDLEQWVWDEGFDYCPNCGAKMDLPEPYNPNIPRDQWEDRARFE